MNRTRFAIPVAVTGLLILVSALPRLACAQNLPSGAVQTPHATSAGTQHHADSVPADDFADLNYTDEQKAQIEEIHRDTEAHKSAVVNDQKLNEDQKNAMLVGYSRIEYGRMLNVLSPAQQKKVRQRIAARKLADQSARNKQRPQN